MSRHSPDAAQRRKVTDIDEFPPDAEFEAHRPHLTAVAARVLGSRTDAEDAVQDAWFRLAKQGAEEIDNLGAWLTRVVARICIDFLRRRQARPEAALDIWELDTTVTDDDGGPDEEATQSDSLGLAMIIVLESLGPEERLAFVLHDLFAMPFAEIAAIIDRSSDAAKMSASRARRKIREVPTPQGRLAQRREAVDAFLAAAREGDFDSLLRLLDPNITWHRYTAHGDSVKVGANEVLAAVRRGDGEKITTRRVNVNGEPGILVSSASGHLLGLMVCTVAGGRLVDIVSIIDRERLSRMELPADR